MRRYRAWIAAAIMLALPQPGRAQSDDPLHPEAFARYFVDAINSKDADRRLAIVHSASRACINPQSQPFFDWIFARRAKYHIPADHRIIVTPIDPGRTQLGDGPLAYPLRPTHQLQIDFDTAPSRGTTIVVLVAFDDGYWREVLPCPRGDAVARAQASLAESEQRDQVARTLVTRMPETLRTELDGLLKAGLRVEAIKRYAAVSGEDLTTAVSVIDLLQSR